MGSQQAKDKGACKKNHAGESPKTDGLPGAFPEPHLMDKSVTVSLCDIENGIQLDELLIFGRKHLDRPENRGQPKTKLKRHGDQLTDILGENNHRGGYP